MLKGVDRLLSPGLLKVLAEMGHGDEIVISDGNFPSASIAKGTVSGEVFYLNCDAPRAIKAVLSVMPLDSFGTEPVLTMQVVGEPDTVPEVVALAEPMFKAEGFSSTSIERFAFYDHARKAYAVIATEEARFYGCFILRKGVLTPDA